MTFDDGIADHGYGFVTHLTMPGGVKVQIYQPKYAKRVEEGGPMKPASLIAAIVLGIVALAHLLRT